MSDYFSHDIKLQPGTKARAEDVNARFDGVVLGFNKLPAPHPSLPGFSEPVAVGDPTNPAHAVSAGQALGGGLAYADDIGIANAYVVNLALAPLSYSNGLTISFKAANANTGPATVNVNGLGIKQLTRSNGNALVAGDIALDQIVTVIFSGNKFLGTAAFAGEFNELADRARALADTAIASVASCTASQVSATGSAGTATTQAGTATTQAGIATTQAGIATAQAVIATTKAGIATTKAQEAVDTLTGANLALKADKSGSLAQFGPTTSLQLKTLLSDETGSGAAVFANSPTLVAPVVGVATGVSFNGLTGLSDTPPIMDSVATVGTSAEAARADHVHPSEIRIQIVTANITLVANGPIYQFNSTGGAFTALLPLSPITGDRIVIFDIGGVFSANSPILSRNGALIMGLAENLTLDVSNSRTELIASGTSYGWIVYAN